MRKLDWDYTDLADHYDRRAGYAEEALDLLVEASGLRSGDPVADLGAGTGKLSGPLARRGFEVQAIEPNARMRAYGEHNTRGLPVGWSEGTGEATGLPSDSIALVTFGSSFNVTERDKALAEAARILRPAGGFACMWNHRDLSDPTQSAVEEIIHRRVPRYGYGTRREDQSATIDASGLFGEVRVIERGFTHELSVEDYIVAWKSHATLARQAGAAFLGVIDEIQAYLTGRESLRVPYHTRIYFARLCPS